jgi:hypothetical protein
MLRYRAQPLRIATANESKQQSEIPALKVNRSFTMNM